MLYSSYIVVDDCDDDIGKVAFFPFSYSKHIRVKPQKILFFIALFKGRMRKALLISLRRNNGSCAFFNTCGIFFWLFLPRRYCELHECRCITLNIYFFCMEYCWEAMKIRKEMKAQARAEVLRRSKSEKHFTEATVWLFLEYFLLPSSPHYGEWIIFSLSSSWRGLSDSLFLSHWIFLCSFWAFPLNKTESH